MTPPGRRSAVAAVGLALFLAPACTSSDDATPDASLPFARAAEGACQASEEAAAGDVPRARAVFLDDVHQGLHDLVDEIIRHDRAVGAELLESKQRVEAGFEAEALDLSERFDRLLQAMDAALIAAGHEPLRCGPR